MKMMLDTKIYNDNWFYNLSTDAKLLFLFLIGNDSCNLIGCYELPLNIICTYTKIPDRKINEVFEELFPKVTYCEGWVMIQRYQKYNPMRNPSIEEAQKKQLESLPPDTRSLFENIQIGLDIVKEESVREKVQGGITLVPGYKEQDKETDKEKGEIVKGGVHDISRDLIAKIAVDYNVPSSFVISKMDDMENWMKAKGKSYKDYYAALRNWVKRDAIQLRKEASTHESKRGIDARGVV